ncbi:MAG: hypothetical protein QOJ02_1539 [Acidobacteriota bacterium]|jgi:hypothetical protein|nr:hypothetical protein [Acidobacteriota bacterium]
MNERTKRGLKVLEAALLLGVLGDGLLRATPWGLNVLLWVGGVCVALVVLMLRWRQKALMNNGHWLLLTSLLSAASFAWRDSLVLNFLAGLTLLVALALMAWRAREGRIWLASITEYFLGMLVAGINAIFIGFPLLLGDVRWKEIPAAGWSRHLRSVLLGAVIAVPLLVIFSMLFMSADVAFEAVVNRFLLTNHEEVFGHIILALVLAWITGGFLRGLLFGRGVTITNDGRARFVSQGQGENYCVAETSVASNTVAQPLKVEPVRLGIVEIGTILGLLNLLFLVFVLLQFRYFFGGAALVQGSVGMTYAEYYRRGFFELVTVAALVLPILLGAHWLLRKDNAAHERIFRLLAATQVALLFVIMASAVRRMLLYQSEYGLTELRLYTTAFMGWLALVFVWFIATVLRGRREQFAYGALVVGFLIVATLHVINPDALIVRVNVAHARAGRGFDADYAASLSADAVPALMESLPVLNAEDQRIVAIRVLDSWLVSEPADWRTWNWARSDARRVVREMWEPLRDSTAAPPPVVQVTELPETISVQSVGGASQTRLPVGKHRKSLTPRRKGAKH